MSDLEKYLRHLKDRKQKLINQRKVVVDIKCPVEKMLAVSHNAKIKTKTDSLQTCILSVENYMRGRVNVHD